MDLAACSALSLRHSDRLWPSSPQCSHLTDLPVAVAFAAALAFGFSFVLCQHSYCLWPDFTRTSCPCRLFLLSLPQTLRWLHSLGSCTSWYRGSRGFPRTSCCKSGGDGRSFFRNKSKKLALPRKIIVRSQRIKSLPGQRELRWSSRIGQQIRETGSSCCQTSHFFQTAE